METEEEDVRCKSVPEEMDCSARLGTGESGPNLLVHGRCWCLRMQARRVDGVLGVVEDNHEQADHMYVGVGGARDEIERWEEPIESRALLLL